KIFHLVACREIMLEDPPRLRPPAPSQLPSLGPHHVGVGRDFNQKCGWLSVSAIERSSRNPRRSKRVVLIRGMARFAGGGPPSRRRRTTAAELIRQSTTKRSLGRPFSMRLGKGP